MCVVNNGIFYQGVRAMETLAEALSDEEYACRMSAIAARCRANFIRYFYDAEKGYFVDSISSRDLPREKHYPAYAIVWTTSFAAELVPDGEAPRIADFMEKHLRDGPRIPQYPKWDSCFMREGNQSAYTPVWERFWREIMRMARRSESLLTWFENVEWYWERHTVPEVHAAEAENEELSLDNPGRQQLFSIKSWYSVFMNVMAGIDVTVDGVTIRPVRKNMEIKGLLIRDMRIDIASDSAGRAVIFVDGRELSGTDRIAFT